MELIKEEIEHNLADFYLSFKDVAHVNFEKNNYIYNIHNNINNWPSFVLTKNYNSSFSDIFGATKTIKNLSKNWILESDFVSKNKIEIKNNKLFPIKNWVGMFLEINSVIPENEINEFTIEKLSSINIDECIALINTVNFNKKILYKELFIDKINEPNFNFFIGKYKNEITSTCIIYNNNKTNGLYFVCTKKTHQNKGFGSLLIKKSINYLIKKGESKFILHATKMGNNIYKKIGFKTYSKLIIFTKI